MSNKQKCRGVDVSELCFDKMSNEGFYNVLSRTKIRFGGFGGSSRAIRKIQIDAGRGIGTTFRGGLGTDGCPFSVSGFLCPAFYYLPICWHGTPSGEWNPVFLRFIFQRFDFRARNNCVWQVKLYCLRRQTILFGSQNNIVPGTFCLFFENEMYSFLKWRAFSRCSVCNHSRFVSRLSDIRKGRVSEKGGF